MKNTNDCNGSISNEQQAEYVMINGIEQFLYHSGDRAENPVILHLHGGPGLPFSNRAYLQSNWNPYFNMVYWDQRGAGKTALKNPDKKPTFENLLQDIHDIIFYLQKKYNQDKIGLFAHSWGTVIGSIYANQFPEHVSFYIGVGQVISPIQDEIVGYKETVRRLQEKGDIQGLQRIMGLGDYPGDNTGDILPKMEVVRNLQYQLGMASYDAEKTRKEIQQSPLFTPKDLNARDISIKLLDQLYKRMHDYSLYDYPLQYSIPVFYLLGENDWQVPAIQGIEYFQKIKAPDKDLIIIKGTTHSPQLEKPEEFLAAMREVVGRN
ncbi:alpha/beta fold hydrolase [Bacillus sp. 1P06AnD]|uniref:alpha/beta fold hydrolase n=1 Tax=Bacillus sp. 1P06AnD TaxID=3132208 RepID=UPI0039A092B1